MTHADDTFVTLRTVYRDPWMLAADKPRGLLVHGDGTGALTLCDLVRDATGVADAQPVQRLDVDTTGLVLFSLDKSVQPALDAAMAGHGCTKRYLALVRGRFPEDGRTIERPIGRDRHDARRMRVSSSGKPAVTHVRTVATREGQSLLLVTLGTGRRHQIRVHLSSMGFPLVGDVLYGGARSKDGLMLHAWQERLSHPVTGEDLRLQTAFPVRFASWWDACRDLGDT